jgi:small subunit ribosomal protein S2
MIPMDEKSDSKHLIELDEYLKTGSHIGTKFKTGDMRRYIFKQRKDGLKVLDVETIDARIRIAAKFLARFDSKGIVVVARKTYGQEPARQFADAIGGKAILGRFIPGTFTNPSAKKFFEPKAIVVTDPEADKQILKEAEKTKAPVVAMCSTNNSLATIDLVIPINNKGRKSMALAYFLLAREVLKEKGEIKKDEDFKKKVDEFEYQLKEGQREPSYNDGYGHKRKPEARRSDQRRERFSRRDSY